MKRYPEFLRNVPVTIIGIYIRNEKNFISCASALNFSASLIISGAFPHSLDWPGDFAVVNRTGANLAEEEPWQLGILSCSCAFTPRTCLTTVWRTRKDRSGAESAQQAIQNLRLGREPIHGQQNHLAGHGLVSKNICFFCYMLRSSGLLDIQHYCSRDNCSILQIT